jgi:Ca-activated chloride channel homolog
MRTRIALAFVVITLVSMSASGQGVLAPRRHRTSAEQRQQSTSNTADPDSRSGTAKSDEPVVGDNLNAPLPGLLPVSSIRIDLNVEGQVATVKVEHLFRNDTDEILEGTYYFPVPEGATLIEFAVYDGDVRRVGRVKEKAEARAAYAGAASQGEDPALLEMTSRGWFQSRVYPIPPHSDKRIEVIYSQVLPEKGGVVSFDYALGQGYKKLKVPVGKVEINADLRSTVGINNVFSPTHPIVLDFDGDTHVRGKVSTAGGAGAENFQLVYSLSDRELGVSLLTHRKKDEDGYFLLMVSPRIEFDERRVSAKDVVFVIDISGSMEGEKLEQAKEALRFGLTKTLSQDDSFNIIAFDDSIKKMSGALIQATPDNIARGLKFVATLATKGGTNINDALVTAMKVFSAASRPHNLVFVTDGEATNGETDPERIASNVRAANAARARLFSFGVGSNVNRVLLERLASENRGAGSFIDDGSKLGGTISTFFAKVNKPVLSDLYVDFGRVQVDRVHPAQLPDLYTRSQIKIYGRYRTAEDLSDITVALSGQMNGQTAVFRFDGLNFPLVAPERDFLPKLWATERVSELLAEIRIHGERPELKNEVIELAHEFNLVTPYTSMYVPTTAELEREGQTIARMQPGVSPGFGRHAGSGGSSNVGQGGIILPPPAPPPPNTVTDPAGSVVPGATVTIRDQNTGATRTVITDAGGNYNVAGLPPGTYSVTVEAPGFKRSVITDLAVQPGQTSTTGVSLASAGVSESVTVTAAGSSLIQSCSDDLAATGSGGFAELPNQNSVESLALLVPGATSWAQQNSTTPNGSPAGNPASSLSINGARARSHTFTIDGQDNNGIDGRPVISLNNSQALSELSINRSPDADGASPTGAPSIAVITKTGTNSLHGSAFVHRIDRGLLGALSPLERRSGLDRPSPLIDTIYGGTLGGPIVRDRVFFFGSLERETEGARLFVDSGSSLLTPTWFGLDQLSQALPQSPTISDLIDRGPLRTQTANLSFVRTLFRPVLGIPTQFGELVRSQPTSARGLEIGARFDLSITSANSLWISYWNDTRDVNGAAGRVAAGFADDTRSRGQLGSLVWTHQFSPRLVSEFSFGFNRARTSLSLSNQTLVGEGGRPSVNVGPRAMGYGSSPFSPGNAVSTTFRTGDTLNYAYGRHYIGLGGHVDRRSTRFDYLPGVGGLFSYATFDDFVLDRPAAITLGTGNPRAEFTQARQHYFIDDSWRALTNLTLSFGLGYSVASQPINQLADRLRTRESNPATALFDPTLPLDLRTIPAVQGDHNNFSPRLGFAYTPRFRPFGRNLFGDERTVFRGGVSVSYDQTAFVPLADAAASAPSVLFAVLTPEQATALPAFPSTPSGADLVSMLAGDPRRFARTEFVRDFRGPYSIAWRLSLAREFSNRVDIEAGYAGTRGIGIVRLMDGSTQSPPLGSEGLSAGPLRVYASTGRSTYHALQTRANLRFGRNLTAGISYTFSKLIDDVPDIGAEFFGGIGSASQPSASTLQTFAQDPGNVSRGERGLASIDRRHSLSAHFVWTLPARSDETGFLGRILSGWQMSGIAGAASGTPFTPFQYLGYNDALLASVFSNRLGSARPFAGNPDALPYTVAFSNAANRFLNLFSNADGSPFESPTGFIIADRSGFHAGTPGEARLLYNDYAVELAARAMGLAPDAFGKTIAAGRPYGDVGRNTFLGPPLKKVDFAVMKTMRLTEQIKLQFRVEAFNLLNHPSRENPNNILENAGGFGFADTGELDAAPRRLRLGLKLVF